MSALVEEIKRRPRPPVPAIARAIRQAARVSQAQIAAELAVHPVTVARWECGTRSPQGDLLRRYVELLDELSRVGAA